MYRRNGWRECQYWLMKSEPEAFSIDDLAGAPKQTTSWDGVRNYQARNFMRAMQVGDQVLYYHSNAHPCRLSWGSQRWSKALILTPPSSIRAVRTTIQAALLISPRWDMVDIRFVRKFKVPLSLDMLRGAIWAQGHGAASEGFAAFGSTGARHGVGGNYPAR